MDSLGACAAPLTMPRFYACERFAHSHYQCTCFSGSVGGKIYFGIGDADTATGGVLEI